MSCKPAITDLICLYWQCHVSQNQIMSISVFPNIKNKLPTGLKVLLLTVTKYLGCSYPLFTLSFTPSLIGVYYPY